jgi:glycosyltransferase involved in cell wall biosynthesis
MILVGVGLVVLCVASLPYLLYLGLPSVLPVQNHPMNKTVATEPVSIVLPTYNEEALIAETLDNLCSLQYPTESLELVIVDSSNDETAAIVHNFFANRKQPALTLIEESDRGGVARAVNRAIEAASHDIIFRTDCDSRLNREAISHAVATLQDETIGAVTGRQVGVLGGSKVETEYRDLQAQNQALESYLDSTFVVHGPCFAFRKRYFEPISADSLADDTEIAVRIRKQGKRILMNPAMQFAEAGTSDLRGRRARKDRRAMGLLQLLDRNRDLLGRYGLYGWVVIPVNWWFLAISPWLSVGGAALVFIGLLTTVPPAGVIALLGAVVGVLLGQQDRLGPLQAPYAVFDAHLSLVIARVRLHREEGDGMWEVDADSRAVFSRES